MLKRYIQRTLFLLRCGKPFAAHNFSPTRPFLAILGANESPRRGHHADSARGTAAGAEDLPRMVFRAALLALFEQAPAWIAVLQYAVAAAFTVAVGTVVLLPFFIARDEDSSDGSQ